jgi:hypothetical protein
MGNFWKSFSFFGILAPCNVRIMDQCAVTRLPVISCYSPALKMEAMRSSETSVQTRPTRRYIPADNILHSHRRENFKSYDITLVYKYQILTNSTDHIRKRSKAFSCMTAVFQKPIHMTSSAVSFLYTLMTSIYSLS